MNARNDKSRSRVTTKQSDFVRGKKNFEIIRLDIFL